MAATAPNPGPYDLGPFQELVTLQWGGGIETLNSNSELASLVIYLLDPLLAPCARVQLVDPTVTMLVTGFDFDDPNRDQSFGTIYNGTFSDNGTGATFRGADMGLAVRCSTPNFASYVGGSSALYGDPGANTNGIGWARMLTIEYITTSDQWNVLYWQNITLTGFDNPPHDRTQFSGPGTFTA